MSTLLDPAKIEPLVFDPRSPQFRANPYPTYDYLRTHHPLYYRPERDDWVLTRYADVVEVLKHPQFGRAEARSISPGAQPDPLHPFWAARQESQQLMQLWLVLRNPPDHTRIRRVLRQPFTPVRIQRLRSHIQTQVDQLLDQASGEMDLISALAFPLTLSLNCQILGIPEANWHPNFKPWSDALAAIADLDITAMAHERGLLAIAGLAAYFREWIDHRRQSPQSQDTLIDHLIQATATGQLSETELIATCIFMFTVGHSSTSNLIGVSILTLLQHPEQWQRLQADITLLPTAIAEVLRYESPVQGVSRTALADIPLSHQTIHKGQVVNCIIAAANRDPAQFPHPHQFDIQRQPNAYLSFGQGMHICIGMHLAKLVAEIVIGRLVTRFPNLTLATPSVDWDDAFLGRGLKSLSVYTN